MSDYIPLNTASSVEITRENILDTMMVIEFLRYDREDDRFTEFEPSDIGGWAEYFGFIRKKPEYTHLLVSSKIEEMLKSHSQTQWNNLLVSKYLPNNSAYLFNIPAGILLTEPSNYASARMDIKHWMSTHKRRTQ